MKTTNIVFRVLPVCLSNICRSPTAETAPRTNSAAASPGVLEEIGKTVQGRQQP
jgi:protein-tyrosine-phosphatase